MGITTSLIFDFLEQRQDWNIDRYEIACAPFGSLRRSLRQIATQFRDSDDPFALAVLDGIRVLLSEWLTVPVPFEQSMLDGLMDLFGPAEGVEARWGLDIRTAYESALRAGGDLISSESPMRDRLRVIVRELLHGALTFKIYCHRQARPHFESLFLPPAALPLPGDTFVHSLRDYRETTPFDCLIKVGPLRARGWGSAPDALVTAPRFGTLAQVVWSDSSDDPNFGYDPILPVYDQSAVNHASVAQKVSKDHGLKWATRVTRYGEDPGAVLDDATNIDDLQYFQEIYQRGEKRAATLVQIDGEHAVLYPPYSQVLSFDPDPAAHRPIDHRVPGQTLHEGMFLISPLVEDIDLGGLIAGHGSYSETWKDRLKHEFHTNKRDFISRLRNAGLNLVHLRSAIEHWCEPPTSVIHAPQQTRHFEILIQVLGLDSTVATAHGRRSWWRLAWDEIRNSRGEAIHTGFVEKEIVENRLLEILRGLLPQIREHATHNVGFRLSIPSISDLRGSFLLSPIIAIEHGFRVPETELKIIQGLRATDKWRD
jgi:hypothetical protein